MMIDTERLEMVPGRLEHLDAELTDPSRLAALLNAEVLPSWPPGEYTPRTIAYYRDRLKAERVSVSHWHIWYAIRRATPESSAILVGCAGFFGAPRADATVEIGYSVVPEWRGCGYATEMVHALVERAFDTGQVVRVVAETDIENAASIAVLMRCGFRRKGIGREPHYLLYERRLADVVPIRPIGVAAG